MDCNVSVCVCLCVYVLFVSVCVYVLLYASVHGFMFTVRIGKTLTQNCNLHVNNITTDQFPHNTSMVTSLVYLIIFIFLYNFTGTYICILDFVLLHL